MKIKGTVARIFCAKENGFKIAALDITIQDIPGEYINPQYPNSISAVGPMKEAEIGYVVEVSGEWEKRDNGDFWPWQFKVKGCTVCMFETPELVAELVGSLAEIGHSKAKKMVDRYGIGLIPILEQEPDSLRPWEAYKGQMKKASAELRQIRLQADMKAFLQKYGIGDNTVEKIQEELGLEAVTAIKANPYVLCEKHLVSFNICDKIAKDMNFGFSNLSRVETVFTAALKDRAGSKGHTYLTATQLLEECNAFLKDNADIPGSFTRKTLAEYIDKLLPTGRIIIDSDRIYAKERFENECAVADILLRRMGKKSPYSSTDMTLIQECISEMQEELGFELDPLQKDAVIMAIKSQTSVLTGGPGCGKTSTLRTVIGVLEKLSCRLRTPMPEIALAAPTGMAAKRIVQSTGREAKTVHKLLEYNPTALFQLRSESNPIDAEFVILDETSMVDIDIAAMLLRAVKDGTQILLLGDSNQLPSIGPGEVLADIIRSGLFPTVELKKSFRHGTRKNILENANRIINGETNLDMRHSDFQFYEIPDSPTDKDCLRLCAKLRKVYYEEYAACGRDASKVQVLSPMKSKTSVSVEKINSVLQNTVNAAIDGENDVSYGSAVFRKNDRVMQVANNYEKNVFNGDMGVVKMVSAKIGKILVEYDGVEVEYTRSEFDQIKHCFAITIHKAQGGEHPTVIMPITGYHSAMLMRNLLYTGVTRAKQKLILIGDKNALIYAIQNVQGIKRNTALFERLSVEQRAA